MNEFESYEYVIKPPRDGKNRMLRVGLVALYVLFVIAWLFFGLITRILVPLLALIPLSLWMLVFATWRFVNVEYEYVVESGLITFIKIYGGKSRKRILQFDIRDAERILPLGDGETSRALDGFDPQKEYFFADASDPETYVALCCDEDNVRLAITFTADSRIMRMIKLYNSSALKRD